MLSLLAQVFPIFLGNAHAVLLRLCLDRWEYACLLTYGLNKPIKMGLRDCYIHGEKYLVELQDVDSEKDKKWS